LPSCPSSRTLRKIGYYAGWGNRGTNCPEFNVSPNQMDLSGYTHVHFAFAAISQDPSIRSSLQLCASLEPSYHINRGHKRWWHLVETTGRSKTTISRTQGVDCCRRSGCIVCDLSHITSLRWQFFFSESDSFSSMTASPTSRATFINSVEAFLNKYELDGIGELCIIFHLSRSQTDYSIDIDFGTIMTEWRLHFY